ncbi:MAG: hypothetical protein K6A80_04380 [Saccharofermentans sp.]|nr:hypothetical protein [Saccharofermentans sp.]
MRKKILILITTLMAACLFLFTGCSEELPEYDNIITALDNYREQYGKYRNSGDTAMIDISHEDTTTISGDPCKSYYIKSPDGKFETVTLEVNDGNLLSVDEYFHLSDKAFTVVRSYIDPETYTPVINRYYVFFGKVYRIDDEAGSLVKVDDETASQFYTSFSDLVAKYGGSNDA